MSGRLATALPVRGRHTCRWGHTIACSGATLEPVALDSGAGGRAWTRAQMQRAVGGYIELGPELSFDLADGKKRQEMHKART